MVDDDMADAVINDRPVVVSEPTLWYRRRTTLAAVALTLAALIGAVIFTCGRGDRATSGGTSSLQMESNRPAGEYKTINDYLNANRITSKSVPRPEFGGREPGSPVIGMGLLAGGTQFCIAPGCASRLRGVGAGAGGRRSFVAEASDRAYAAVQWESVVDQDDPPTLVVLLTKLTGDVDPAKILEYASGELENLPSFQPIAEGDVTLSGFDAVQIAGNYMLDGKQRSVAEKTVVIPSTDATYLLQFIVGSLEGDAATLVKVTQTIDAMTVIKF